LLLKSITTLPAFVMKNNQKSESLLPVDPWPIAVLKENEHYYMENGFMVFTGRYHLARGSCCGNHCRHCPFDYVNVSK